MPNETAEQLRVETEMLANLYREQKDSDGEGRRVALSVDEVPDEIGNYTIMDGLECRGGGVTYHMRASITSSSWFSQLKRPIFFWKPDTDGSVALWLDGKIRCSLCESKQVIDLSYIDEHRREVHGVKEECGR